MNIPDGWVLVPREPTVAMLEEARSPLLAMDYAIEDAANEARYGCMLRAAPPAPIDPEITAGMAMDGAPGAIFRLIDRCDYREVMPWLRGEIVRGTEDTAIFHSLVTLVSSVITQAAGMVARTQMHGYAGTVFEAARRAVIKDLEAIKGAKKTETVLRNKIRVIEPGHD